MSKEPYPLPRKHKPPSPLLLLLVGLLLAFTLIVLFLAAGIPWPEWTGFVTTPAISNGGAQPKTLWDWMELLLIPATLALAALWLSEHRAFAEEKLESERDRRQILEAYISRISDLLLDHDLRSSPPDAEQRRIATAWTSTALAALDPNRKGELIEFLFDADLISSPSPIISLAGADLEAVMLPATDLSGACLANIYAPRADFSFADLDTVDLTEAFLVEADLRHSSFINANISSAFLAKSDLRGSDLQCADLSYTDLTHARVTNDQLQVCRSLEATVSPDGSRHD